MLTCSIKTFKDFSLCSQMKNMSSLYLHQIIGFFFKAFKHFFLKIYHERNSIRRRILCSYCSSTFLFESLFSKFKYVILQDYLRKFCQSITRDLFVIPSFQKPTERRKTFPVWYIRVKTNNVHCTKDRSNWQTS